MNLDLSSQTRDIQQLLTKAKQRKSLIESSSLRKLPSFPELSRVGSTDRETSPSHIPTREMDTQVVNETREVSTQDTRTAQVKHVETSPIQFDTPRLKNVGIQPSPLAHKIAFIQTSPFESPARADPSLDKVRTLVMRSTTHF